MNVGEMKLVIALSLLLGIVNCNGLTSMLTHLEQQRIVGQLNQAADDLKSIYYSVTGLKALAKTPDNVDGICQQAASQLKQDNIISVFHYSEVVAALGCKNIPKISLNSFVNDATEAITFSRVVIAMRNFGLDVDDTTVKKFVAAAKDNDTPTSAALAFYAASLLPKSPNLQPIVSMVEDIVAQADEINGELLQFEGGLSVTSSVVRGIIKLSDQQGAALTKEDRIIKFARYFLNRKYVYSLEDIHYLLTALQALSNNQHQVPVVVSTYKSNLITKENPVLKVRVTNVLDQSVPNAAVVAKSFKSADGNTNVFENKPFTKSNEKDDYIIVDGDIARGYIAAHSFGIDILALKPARGLYKCSVQVKLDNVEKENVRFIAGGSFVVNAKVLAKIMVNDVKIGVADRDQSSVSKTSSLKYPEKLSTKLEADYHQKVVMTFNLKDVNSGELTTAHQTFVRLVHEKTGQEIFFIAEPDSGDNYKFTLDVSATAKESFNHLSGNYKMSLVVGDSTMQVPISWHLSDIELKFSGEPKKSKRQERITDPKPVIEHMFRVPEKRPPQVVSMAFTGVVFSLLLVMVGMWVKIGVNLSNLRISIPTLVFHFGLAAIFGLYYMFWIQINMFQTLKLLALIGALTFLGGNKMLADMAASKYKP